MKILAVVTLVLWVDVLVFANITIDKLNDAMNQCVEETKVDQELVKKALHGQVADDPKLKANIECFFKKVEIVNGDQVDKDKLKEFLTLGSDKSEEEIQKMVDECADKQGATPQDKIVEVFKCSMNKILEL